VALNLLHALPHRPPVVHLRRDDAQGRFAGAACGQVSMDGKGHARTPHTTDATRVTCKKCRKALERAAA